MARELDCKDNRKNKIKEFESKMLLAILWVIQNNQAESILLSFRCYAISSKTNHPQRASLSVCRNEWQLVYHVLGARLLTKN